MTRCALSGVTEDDSIGGKKNDIAAAGRPLEYFGAPPNNRVSVHALPLSLPWRRQREVKRQSHQKNYSYVSL